MARSTLDFVAREMTLPDGVFAASLDADTDGEEGATYTWTSGEIRDALVAAGREADVELFARRVRRDRRGATGRVARSSGASCRTRSWPRGPGVPEDEVRSRLADDRAGAPARPGTGGRSPPATTRRSPAGTG